MRIALALCLIASAITTASFAQDEELSPGLIAKHSGGGRAVELVEPDISASWGASAPDSRLPNGAFRSEWSGMLLVQQDAKFRWHAFAQGRVRVELDGAVVLEGTTNEAKWISGDATEIGVGFKKLRVLFESTGPKSELHLFWSSELFPLEPLPGQLLFHESPPATIAAFETGRQLFAAKRCGACHQRDVQAAPLSAPSLADVTSIAPDWLLAQLTGNVPSSRMPNFGFTRDEAADVAAFLRSNSQTVKLESLPKPEKKQTDDTDRAAGAVLLRSVGCLACHAVNEVGTSGPFSGADLSAIGSKRTTEWLFSWLGDPGKLNPQHRMPVFRLTSPERRQLALAMSSLKREAALPQSQISDFKAQIGSGKDSIARGRVLVTAARCAACHQIPGVERPDLKTIATLAEPVADWSKSCLDEKADRTKWRPAFGVGLAPNVPDLKAYLDATRGAQSAPSSFATGRALLESKNCLACHPRGTTKGLAAHAASILQAEPALAGLAPTLVPPNLTAVGDKLLDAALAQAISGEQVIRKPWLKVRMPKFVHTDDEKAALLAYFIGHDRIPDAAPETKPRAAELPVDDQTLVLGQTLVGPKGMSCIACHQMGSYVPKNAAIGTRGSDLLTLRARMREPFFERWVNSPLRIVPGMEMPAYATRPVKGVLDDDIYQQLDTLWRTLNDPRFQAPTDPGSVEQYVVVGPNAPAKIIRDVFTNPEANGGGSIARSLVVGFANQHAVIYDLDTLTLRGWTFGDLARQRTVGKSWYWDLAGSPIVSRFSRESDYLLVPVGRDVSTAVAPRSEFGTLGRLVGYQPYRDGVEFSFDLNFEVAQKLHVVRVTERLLPVIGDGSPQGWSRDISIDSVPTGFDVLLARPSLRENATLGQPTIARQEPPRAEWLALPSSDAKAVAREVSRLVTKDGQAAATLRYMSSLQSPPLVANLKPNPPAPQALPITSTPGFDGVQLPLPASIMPTAMTFRPDGTLAFVSLKGDVFIARDTNGDGVEDSLTLVEEGLAAPYGVIADGDSLLVAHKPELLRLRDTNGDGRADQRTVFATGWGYNDNYHDWTCGIVRDASGNLFVGTGSDYSQPGRKAELSRWRGKVLKIAADGSITPFAHAFRYPTGLAMDARGNLFATDNQGEQNCFNEINHIREGEHYGVESLHERAVPIPGQPPALQVPHPWTRSVNGLAFLPVERAASRERGQAPHISQLAEQSPVPEKSSVPPILKSAEPDPRHAFAGHGLGCEYNGRFLIRFTTHEVGGQLQGAVFPFSKPDFADIAKNFQGPLSIAVSPRGDIYVGSIHDSGWLGGLNTGSIVRLRAAASSPNGLQDIRATSDGFELSFIAPVDRDRAADSKNYAISGYARVWQGTYETPDSGRYQPPIASAVVSADGRSVRLKVERLKTGFVYDIGCRNVFDDADSWPTQGYYTMHRMP